MKTKICYALPFVALLAACSENVAGEAPSVENAVPATTPSAVPATERVAQTPAEATPPAPAPEEWTIGEVTRVVPVDFSPAAYLIYTTGNVVFRVEFYASDIVRIQAARNGEFEDPLNDPTAAQILVDDMPVLRERVTCEFLNNRVFWKTGAATLMLDSKRGTFSLYGNNGNEIWSETQPLSISKKTTTQHLKSHPDEFYYGCGQQQGHFSHKGAKRVIAATGWTENQAANPAPFYMSNRGYAVLRHTFATGEYDFRDDNVITTRHNESRFDAIYFVGDTFPRLLDLYTRCTGRPNFIPIWGFELGDADAYMTRDKKTKEPLLGEDGRFVELTPYSLERVAEKYREHDMPGGWMLVNDGYGCNYTQLPYVVKSLGELGFQTGLWTEGALIRMAREVGVAGTRVQKLDVAWSSDVNKTTRAKKLSPVQHTLECNKMAWDGIANNSDSRPLTWTVLGWAGTQRYAVCWSGDQSGNWDLIRYHIPTLITSGMSGQAYATTDVDGIFGGSPETYTRDLQWKCFTPAIYVMNGWSDGEAISGVPKKSPWWFDEPYRSINRKYLKLKGRMLPYMYKYAHDAALTGAPIVRGLIWNYPQDRKTWDATTQYEFMVGEDLLVAPVFTSMLLNKGWRKEDIYLPEGQWVDYWDGRRVPGNYTIDAYPITLEKLPIFVRAGAIIPMYPEMLYGTQKPKDQITFDIYPWGKSSFEMYEDDGTTRAYRDGAYTKQRVSVAAGTDKSADIAIEVDPVTGHFEKMYKERSYAFEVHYEFEPVRVLVNGEEIYKYSGAAAFENSQAGWYYDPADRKGIVHIKTKKQSIFEPLSVVVDCPEGLALAAFEPYPLPPVTGELDKSEFAVSASSAQPGAEIKVAFDGDPNTIWHSKYGKHNEGDPAYQYPYTVDIDLGKVVAVNGFAYAPRQDLGNGTIKGYEIWIAGKDRQFQKVAEGEWQHAFADETRKTAQTQRTEFPTAWARYVRLVATSSRNGDSFASAGEFDVLQDLNAEALPDEEILMGDGEAFPPKSVEGEAAFNRSLSAETLVVDGNPVANGIAVRAGTTITYCLNGEWEKLLGFVGREAGGKGEVTFDIYADGKQVFNRRGMSPTSVKQLIDLDISGVQEIKLVFVADQGGDPADTGVWTEMRLTRKQ
ncbi:MAG: NPCBM/NEW2 domain-containing protein [Opitutales bacterium]|nr:NPCBM/NEW2 domain-containing protein [Opitutales bacterium]